MLLKHIKILILILSMTEIFCMDELDYTSKAFCRNRKIKVFIKDNEIIYKFGKTLREKLDKLFKDIDYFIQKGNFFKAKKKLKSYCEQLIKNSGQEQEIQNLKELLVNFNLNSEKLLENLNSNLNLIRLESKETLKVVELLVAFCMGLVGLYAIDSGIVLLAFVIALAGCFDPIILFSVSTIITFVNLEDNHEMISKFVLGLSLIFMFCLKKINDKWIEKKMELREIKEIISDFEEKLMKIINTFKDNSALNISYE